MGASVSIRRLIVLVLALGCSVPVPALGEGSPSNTARESPARATVENLIQQSRANVSVAFRSLDGTSELFIQAGTPFEYPAAMKIPVMIELYARVNARELRWDDTVPVHATFRSVADGSTYDLDLAAAPKIFATAKTMTLRQLCDAMILRDSDLAANLLMEKLGLDAIRQRIHALGPDGMDLVAGFGDSKAAVQGLKNVTTSRALMVILWSLANDQVVSADDSKQMMGLMARSGLQAIISGAAPMTRPAARRPAGADHHEATIIIGARSFVLVTDVRGLADAQASALVARIAHAVSRAM